MSPTDAAASVRRYRTRHTTPRPGGTFPAHNLLWRSPKVPLTREEATEQLELLTPEHFADVVVARGLPDPERLRWERVQRTIGETLDGFRPQLNRMVREIQMQLNVDQSRHPDHQVVASALRALEQHVQRFVADSIASESWSHPTGRS